jgi:hypothetical protein
MPGESCHDQACDWNGKQKKDAQDKKYCLDDLEVSTRNDAHSELMRFTNLPSGRTVHQRPAARPSSFGEAGVGQPRLTFLRAEPECNLFAPPVCPECYQTIDNQDKRQSQDIGINNTMCNGAGHDRPCPHAE